jgi:ribosomal protein S12 methylthiotransferase accessory factor
MEMEINFPGNLRVDSTYRGFTTKTDQPREDGGDGRAPEPFDLFLSSIGTCAGVYVLYFCRERNIDTAGISLRLSFSRNDKTHMIEKVDIRILLPESFPEKYRHTVARIAGMCTVKKHLFDPPEFTIQAVPAESV